MKKFFDFLIIGAGPAGYTAAIRAAQLGAKVGVIEKDDLGGTCLNKGCIPTKLLVTTAHILDCLKKAKEFGIFIEEKKIDFPSIMNKKERIIKQLKNGIKYLLKSYNIETIKGNAYFVSTSEVRAEGEIFGFKKCIIATGSYPSNIPGINVDHKHIMTSDDMLSINKIPSSLLIIGGGVIGLEFAYIFQSFGTKVSVIEVLPSILPNEDREVSKALEKNFKERGIDIKTNTIVKTLKYLSEGIEAVLESPKGLDRLLVEKVLIAVGRKACIKGLGLENIGINCEDNKIVVNEKMETNIKGIYAIGDVTGAPFLAHKAYAQAIVAVENAMGKEAIIDYKAMPRCIFTSPEVASVGLTETEAKKYRIKIGKFPFMANGKAITMGETEGFIKVVADRDSDKVLGIHIIGIQATELIAHASLAIKLQCTTRELTRIIYPHPTLSEAIFQAVLDVNKISTDLPSKHKVN
ncbi:MAG TPA: dihydrolipoyl dehydrogenase [Candidatus Desulfofervidus auxilii]|uniref:Dihydrolipoyl dehydrogenase n=1 Tax=Desulfofervidus auxilii TaxID=1621989 RepID=A0A7V0I9H9_DESA2|nr:dihydrolipoyl dehydrogenase [Candidatus Desulfofervidus auxilii]